MSGYHITKLVQLGIVLLMLWHIKRLERRYKREKDKERQEFISNLAGGARRGGPDV